MMNGVWEINTKEKSSTGFGGMWHVGWVFLADKQRTECKEEVQKYCIVVNYARS